MAKFPVFHQREKGLGGNIYLLRDLKMRYAVHRNVMLLLRGCALFYMPQDDCSAVLQGGSMTISGSSNMGGPPGLKISGLRIHVNLSLFQRVGIDQK